MKNLVLILSVAISLSILSGCGDSDSFIDPGPETETPPDVIIETPPDDIVGYWKMTKIVKDGVDLTDDFTTRSDLTISKTNQFYGKDFDVVQNACLSTTFNGTWVYKISNEYTFSIYGNEFIAELYGDTLRAQFIHAFDGKEYIEEHLRQQ